MINIALESLSTRYLERKCKYRERAQDPFHMSRRGRQDRPRSEHARLLSPSSWTALSDAITPDALHRDRLSHVQYML